MHAVIHTGQTPAWAEPLSHPWPLLPIANRLWIEYWIEWGLIHDIRKWNIVLGDGAYEIEHDLGDGNRWGIEIQYSFLRDAGDPEAFLRRDPGRWKDGLCYIRNPVFPRRLSDETPAPLGVDTFAAVRPTGLDIFFSRDPYAIESLIAGTAKTWKGFPEQSLVAHSLTSLQDYFDLNMSMVKGEISRYLTPGYRRQDQAYLGYNVIYPAAASLTPPLMIGNQVRLRGLSNVGPNAILGNRVIVDRQAEVRDSLILDGTYLGAGIEVQGRIVAGRRLIDPSDGTALDIEDTHLLAPLRQVGATGEKARRLVHRLVAFLLFIALSPLALLLMLMCWFRGGRYRREAIIGVRGPCTVERWVNKGERPGLFCRLSLHEWPLLARVVAGQLWLCGQLPVLAEERDELQHWPTYRPGLFTYADLRSHREDPVLRRIEATYYAHHRGWAEDLRILFRGWWSRLAGHTTTTDECGDLP